MIGYKVVIEDVTEGRTILRSVACPSDGRVKYKQWHQTKPLKNCGPLAVFDTLEHALSFLKNDIMGGMSELFRLFCFECDYVEDVDGSSHRVFALWTKEYFLTVKSLPFGTKFASSVTLKKCVAKSVDHQLTIY